MKTEDKVLLVLTPGFPASEEDSTCLPMQQDFVKAVKRMYPDLEIIVLAFQYPYNTSTYRWHGVTVISFNGRNKGGLQRLLLRNKISTTLGKIIKEKKIIGLLSFWYGECAVAGKKFGKRNGIKHGCWVLGQDARKTNAYPRRVPPDPHELIALSDFLQDEFERNHGVRPGFVIPPGIDEQRFLKENSLRDIDILGVGSLIPLKQFNMFIELVDKIRNRLPNIRVVLIGEGPEKDHLQAQIERAGLQGNVRLAGELPYDEVLEVMQRSKLLLHPSAYEGFSGVCMEALAAGMKVVSLCRAMKGEIENWHIFDDEVNMEQKAIAILEHESFNKQMITFRIEDTAEKMMKFFMIDDSERYS
jgi:glycosyltransferase involved in cell wall biosynthesis